MTSATLERDSAFVIDANEVVMTKCSVESCWGDADAVAQLMVELPSGEPTLYRLTDDGFVPITGSIRVLAPVCVVHRRNDRFIPATPIDWTK